MNKYRVAGRGTPGKSASRSGPEAIRSRDQYYRAWERDLPRRTSSLWVPQPIRVLEGSALYVFPFVRNVKEVGVIIIINCITVLAYTVLVCSQASNVAWTNSQIIILNDKLHSNRHPHWLEPKHTAFIDLEKKQNFVFNLAMCQRQDGDPGYFCSLNKNCLPTAI
jgi:hypothetical protein